MIKTQKNHSVVKDFLYLLYWLMLKDFLKIFLNINQYEKTFLIFVGEKVFCVFSMNLS